jgi:hypothetical protein
MSHRASVPLPWNRISGDRAPTSIQRANTSRSAKSLYPPMSEPQCGSPMNAQRWRLTSTLRRPRSVDGPVSGCSGMSTPSLLWVSPPHVIAYRAVPVNAARAIAHPSRPRASFSARRTDRCSITGYALWICRPLRPSWYTSSGSLGTISSLRSTKNPSTSRPGPSRKLRKSRSSARVASGFVRSSSRSLPGASQPRSRARVARSSSAHSDTQTWLFQLRRFIISSMALASGKRAGSKRSVP